MAEHIKISAWIKKNTKTVVVSTNPTTITNYICNENAKLRAIYN